MSDDAVGAAEPRHHLEQRNHVLLLVRGAGLLAVTERGIGDMDIARLDFVRVELDLLAVDGFLDLSFESDQRGKRIGKGVFKEIRG